MNYPEDMIGAIKIKDGLFIGDSFAAQVSYQFYFLYSSLFFYCIIGSRVCGCKQSDPHYQLCW
jgi:hypothetical protein